MSQTQPDQNDNQISTGPQPDGPKPDGPARRNASVLLLVLTVLVLGALVYALVRSGNQAANPAPATPPPSPTAPPTATAPAKLAVVVSATDTLSPTASGIISGVTNSPLATPAEEAASAASHTGAFESPLAAGEGAFESPLAAALPALTPTLTITPRVLPVYTYEVVKVYPHDPNAFTQGLDFDGDTLYEGTGLNGRSSLRRVDLATGKVLQQIDLAPNYFGEGIVVWGDQIDQLTWQSQQGFVYDKKTFEQRGDFTYPTEGWGITEDGRHLIMSDGSPTLYFWDPVTFKPVDSVDVYDLNGPVEELNELEYVKGEVYANIWQTDRIARIDPVSGQVLGWIDLSGLLTPEERASADVLNGIAYMPESDRLFVTGKLWPKLFEIKLVPQE